MRIGIQGTAGSYSEMTALDYIEKKQLEQQSLHYDIIQYTNFAETTKALLNEDVDLIAVPVENSTTGVITKMLDQIRYKPVIATAEAYQPVSHTLWGIQGSRVEHLTHVYSHPEALSQCNGLFEHHPHIEAKAYSDTASATRYVKESNSMTVGAIASARAGELYKLIPLLEDVQDEKSNMTRFYIIEKKETHKKYEGTILSFYIETHHESGALLKVLQVFDIFNGNLLSLTARPIENKPFTYGFFLEVSIERLSTSVDILTQTLSQVAQFVQLTGQFYPEPRPEGY